MNPDHGYNHEWFLQEQQADYDLPKVEVMKQSHLTVSLQQAKTARLRLAVKAETTPLIYQV